jgi:hypothetical protein
VVREVSVGRAVRVALVVRGVLVGQVALAGLVVREASAGQVARAALGAQRVLAAPVVPAAQERRPDRRSGPLAEARASAVRNVRVHSAI